MYAQIMYPGEIYFTKTKCDVDLLQYLMEKASCF